MLGDTCGVSKWAAKTPSRCAIKAGERSLTFRDWEARIAEMTGALAGRGVVLGDRVALIVDDPIASMTIMIALFHLGAVACPINPAFPDAYRAARLAQLDCALVLVEHASPSLPEALSLSTITAAPELMGAVPEPLPVDPDRPGLIIFTSGSTGAPKAAVLSVENFRENARLSNGNILLEPGDIWLLALPLHHVAGLGVMFRCLEAGATIALPNPEKSLDNETAASRATHLSLVARQLARMLETHETRRILARTKAILLGGSAIPDALIAAANSRKLPIFTTYGMTEMATQVTTTWPGADSETLRSSGRAQRAGVIRINSDGEIEVNGPSRFLGYWEQGAITRPFDAEGWFRTGDRGSFDLIGNLHVTGRVDNMFVCGGENVQPEMVEQALSGIDGLEKVLIVPIPHAEFGATPVAFVLDTQERSSEVLQQAMAEMVPAFQVPRHLFSWPTELEDGGLKISRSRFIEEACRRVADAKLGLS